MTTLLQHLRKLIALIALVAAGEVMLSCGGGGAS